MTADAPGVDREAIRLAALRRYQALDSPPEPEFDELTQVAAAVFAVPIVVVSLVDGARIWFKSQLGLDASEMPRAGTFCDAALESPDGLEVRDATLDSRFSSHPMVTGAPYVRFYAGCPLTTPDGHRIGMLAIVDTVPRSLTPDEWSTLARLARCVMRQFETRAGDRRTVMEAAFQRAIFDSAGLAIVVTDSNGIIDRLNPAAERLLGWTDAEVAHRFTPLQFHDPEELRQRADELSKRLGRPLSPGAEYFRTLLAGGAADKNEWTFIRKDGVRIPVQLSLSAVHDADGRFLGFLGIIDDVTERRLAEEATQSALREKEGLLREIHHRVKNNLQIISSLLRFQAKQLRDPRDIGTFAAARDRLRSMVLVHEMLYQSRELSRINLPDYLARLLRELSGPVETAPSPHDLRLDCVDVDLHADQALPLGMMVTELVTNAVKYAYAPAQHGVVDVRAVRQGDRLVVSVVDEGRGIPGEADLQQPESFGWRLIRMLAGQLGADIAVRRSPGTRVDVSLPLKPAG